MQAIDSDGLMKVMINGAVHRRRAHIRDVVQYLGGDPTFTHAVPELRAGEVLLETIGGLPIILQSGLLS